MRTHYPEPDLNDYEIAQGLAERGPAWFTWLTNRADEIGDDADWEPDPILLH